MSQQVLCCYKCHTFQVHQLKKDPKWVCKICNEKQSTKQIFGSGSGAECRKLVQELNMKRATLDETDSLERPPYEHSDELADDQTATSQMTASSNSHMNKSSKWDKYL